MLETQAPIHNLKLNTIWPHSAWMGDSLGKEAREWKTPEKIDVEENSFFLYEELKFKRKRRNAMDGLKQLRKDIKVMKR